MSGAEAASKAEAMEESKHKCRNKILRIGVEIFLDWGPEEGRTDMMGIKFVLIYYEDIKKLQRN